MIYRSKAPLRIGLAGGGTDVSPYSDLFGGAVLNAAISLYAHAVIEPIAENKIIIEATDRNEQQEFECGTILPYNGTLDLHKAVCNRIQKDHSLSTGFKLSSVVDAPAGSGLGTSSTLVVALLGAFTKMLQLSLDNYQVAQYAYAIERNDLQLPGGKQDQYAASFGGMNFMEFFAGNKVTVQPLKIAAGQLQELEQNLVLYFTDTSRDSNAIITEQMNNVTNKNLQSIEAMHQLKMQAKMMREALLSGHIDAVGPILDYGFTHKKQMAHNISNTTIENIYAAAQKAGASGGKISGAGGGGFMIFYCPGNSHNAVMETLNSFGGVIKDYHFVNEGMVSRTE